MARRTCAHSTRRTCSRRRPLTSEASWDDGAVVIRGTELPERLAVVPIGALRLGSQLVPTAGSWERSDAEARFTPRFPAGPGSRFVILELRDDGGDPWRELAFVDAPERETARRTSVESIDPRALDVPANLLRFSALFSSVMKEGSAAGRIHLLDENGVDLAGTLLEMPPELWDRDRRRLTVLLEPGRIKRGLQPHEQAGPPLRAGTSVTLVVDADIRDAAGSPLVEAARRTYRIGAAIRSRIDPQLWDVTWPTAPSGQLRVRFDRPLDRVLVGRYLRVLDSLQELVPGSAVLDEAGQSWVFDAQPGSVDATTWSLRIDSRLEDLAGNSVRRVFDRDLERPEDDGLDATEVILSRSAQSPASR
jgi:hypothetical protein